MQRTAYFNSEKYLRYGQDAINHRKCGIKKILKNVFKDRILDLGCGDGSISLQLFPETRHITFVDSSESMILKCQSNVPAQFTNSVNYVLSTIENYVPAQTFDVVLCIGVLAHVKNIPEVIKKVTECMKLGSYCILQITDYANFWSKYMWVYSTIKDFLMKRYGYKLNRITRDSLITIANIQGLTFIEEYWYDQRVHFVATARSEVLMMFRKNH